MLSRHGVNRRSMRKRFVTSKRFFLFGQKVPTRTFISWVIPVNWPRRTLRFLHIGWRCVYVSWSCDKIKRRFENTVHSVLKTFYFVTGQRCIRISPIMRGLVGVGRRRVYWQNKPWYMGILLYHFIFTRNIKHIQPLYDYTELYTPTTKEL